MNPIDHDIDLRPEVPSLVGLMKLRPTLSRGAVKYRGEFVRVQAEAREAGRGVWNPRDRLPLTPATFRKLHRDGTTSIGEPSRSPTSSSTFSCSVRKTKCGEMTSCEEATLHLNSCGNARLDRDKDGVPCESVCQ